MAEDKKKNINNRLHKCNKFPARTLLKNIVCNTIIVYNTIQ